jgi:hypothetical protein
MIYGNSAPKDWSRRFLIHAHIESPGQATRSVWSFSNFSPLTTGLLQPVAGDRKLPPQKYTQLDKLYQRVADDLSKLMDALGLKAAA